MISAGTIGGGVTPSAPNLGNPQLAPLQAQPPQGYYPPVQLQQPTLGLGQTDLQVPVAQGINMGNVDGNKLIDSWNSNNSANRWFNTIGGSIQQFFGAAAGIWSQSIAFDTAEHMKDSDVAMQEHLSDNQVTTIDRLATMQERVKPQEIRAQRDETQIRDDGETRRYKLHLDSIERQASLRDLPNYFMGRPSAVG